MGSLSLERGDYGVRRRFRCQPLWYGVWALYWKLRSWDGWVPPSVALGWPSPSQGLGWCFGPEAAPGTTHPPPVVLLWADTQRPSPSPPVPLQVRLGLPAAFPALPIVPRFSRVSCLVTLTARLQMQLSLFSQSLLLRLLFPTSAAKSPPTLLPHL